jgi:hypothetical protein
MQFKIDELHFRNSHGDYLDIEINHLEKYISVKTDTTGEFSFESELEIDIVCQKLKEILKAVNGDNTHEVDMRIPGVGC